MGATIDYVFIGDDFTGASDTLATLAQTGRRARLFLASQAAVAAAGVVVAGTPAGAANGDNLKVGQVNTGSATTRLNGSQLFVDDGNGGVGITVTQSGTNSYGIVSQAVGTGAVGLTAQSIAAGGGWGIYAYSSGSDGTYSETLKTGAAGVRGGATNGDGVVGQTTNGNGVKGTCTKGAAVYGVTAGANATAVHGEHGGAGVGVAGESDTGTGVYAYSANGPSLFLQGDAAMPPTTGQWYAGSVVFNDGLWLCLVSGVGAASKWVKLSRAFVPLDAPTRVYDSRPGKNPLVGPKVPMANGTERDVSAATGGAVPAGLATAVAVNLTVTGTGPAGFVSLYRNGIPWPGNSSINWDAPGTTIANGTVVAVDPAGLFTVRAKSTCDVVIDVVGYYT